MEKNDLKKMITDAFPKIPVPTGILCDGPQDDEGVSDFFSGKQWDECQLEDLRFHYVALSLFNPTAFRYYLPAFMLAAVNNSSDFSESITFHFGEPADYFREIYNERIRCFAQPEKAAILAFFKYLQETDDLTSLEVKQIDYACKTLKPKEN